jgi:group I intron endonuclease
MDLSGRFGLPQKGSVIVYLLANQVNGKSYVGQTRNHTLARRWNRSLKNSANAHLAAAITKYGPKSFKRTILAHASCQEELDLLEKFFIAIFQTCDPRFGYNQQTGGLIGPGRHSKETIQRITDSNKRYWEKKTQEEMVKLAENARLRWDMWPKERKQKWADVCRERWWGRSQEDRERIIELVRKSKLGKKRSTPAWNKGLLGWNAGYQKTEEHRKHMSEAMKMRWEQKRGLPPKKPSASVKDTGANKSVRKADERRAMAALKEVSLAEYQLREIKQRLNALKFELQGGCLW